MPQNRQDLASITELVEAGKVKVVIDKTFALEEVPDAFRYIHSGAAKGKIVIMVEDE